jgi:predicted GIY-YIG superfamily endonuclease
MDFTNGKIYKLVGNGKVYIGSTTQPLLRRFNHHKNNLTGSIREMLTDDFHIELVENYACNNRTELEARERYWINSTECVNKRITDGLNKSLYMKTYRLNRDTIRLRRLKTKIYNQIPAIISNKLDEYLKNNSDKSINDIIKDIINPAFV